MSVGVSIAVVIALIAFKLGPAPESRPLLREEEPNPQF